MKKIFLTSIIFSLLFSCDILHEDPKTVLPPDGYYDTKTGMETLVNACYARLRSFTASTTNLLQLTEQGTDIFEAGVDGDVNFDTYSISLTAGQITSVWENCYIGINACNNVMHYIGAVSDMSDSEKKIREAEARFLRAYMYYHLIMQFGDVHLSLEPTVGVQTEANRTPVAQILDEAIYPDLRFAVEYLPTSQSDYGRIDQFGAKFFLSYVLLSDERSSTSEFEEAAALATNVITDSQYTLLEERSQVFDQENDMNKEIIWSLQFSEDESLRESGNETHLYFAPKYDVNIPGMVRAIKYGRPYSRFKPTQFALDLYDEAIDSRYQAYWRDTWYAIIDAENIAIGDTAFYLPKKMWNKDQIDSKKYMVFNPEFSESLGSAYSKVNNRVYVQMRKFDDTKRLTINETKGTRDWVCFRTAEAYLLAGEAYYRAGDIDNALKYINTLRRNCAIEGKEKEMEISASDLSVDFILDERARELCGEGKRWYDLKRLGRLVERASKYNSKAANMQTYHLLRPIPQSQIDRCSNVYQQNPGW
ncbi:RagB/SusD family nutrient uptake outer membrane protein [Parabacteroides johnsonii]|jgi:tetratricopeptide (TPR) repeat protein|uniref:RagB/SusD family nutrient uptake outer membrane protein n=1 Tax=Parabacteroides johnsonii TaxID=387661 RepID=A0A9Q5SUA2_9BACT|nr:RagB/SusD family nutrient uptake outer membrane protein [Parabacteroides johnsonii]OUO07335.1 RagB/SusD family nutrient uptake outer membrane protein [Parabacteroides johnsonii]CCX76958.1 susD family protein [Parabacteroides johnsonii CAG:246]